MKPIVRTAIRYLIPIGGTVLLPITLEAAVMSPAARLVNAPIICEAIIIVCCLTNIVTSREHRLANIVWSLSMIFISAYALWILSQVVLG